MGRAVLVLSLLLCGVVLPGCGGGPSAVKGVVIIDGQPLSKAVVSLQPDGEGRPASATTDEGGQFTMSTKDPGDGVFPGKYSLVIVVPKAPTNNPNAPQPNAGGAAGGDPNANRSFLPGVARTPDGAVNDRLQKVPERYRSASTSPIKVTVPTSGQVRVEIKSEPDPSAP